MTTFFLGIPTHFFCVFPSYIMANLAINQMRDTLLIMKQYSDFGVYLMTNYFE